MKNNDLFQASRRRFLMQLGGLTVAGMLGPSLLTPRSANAAEVQGTGVKEGILTGSHWGAIRATVVDGRFIEAKPFEHDKYPSKMIAGLPDHVHGGARIRYPMVRVDWLRKRHQSDTTQRGDNRFVRVSWDEALDFFYQELERIQKTYGPSALLTASGWQSTGMFHNASGMLARAIALHGNSVSNGCVPRDSIWAANCRRSAVNTANGVEFDTSRNSCAKLARDICARFASSSTVQAKAGDSSIMNTTAPSLGCSSKFSTFLAGVDWASHSRTVNANSVAHCWLQTMLEPGRSLMYSSCISVIMAFSQWLTGLFSSGASNNTSGSAVKK